jgi:SET domain-containing protein
MPATPAKRPYAVRRSTIHGRGVFATSHIPKGDRIIEYRGERITDAEADRRHPADPTNPYHTFFFSTDGGAIIDAGVGGNAARWINHSCKPNCEAIEDDVGRVFIVAKKPIEPGAELAYDYRLFMDGRVSRADREGYACRCGAKKCRGSMLLAKKKKKKKKGKKD